MSALLRSNKSLNIILCSLSDSKSPIACLAEKKIYKFYFKIKTFILFLHFYFQTSSFSKKHWLQRANEVMESRTQREAEKGLWPEHAERPLLGTVLWLLLTEKLRKCTGTWATGSKRSPLIHIPRDAFNLYSHQQCKSPPHDPNL